MEKDGVRLMDINFHYFAVMTIAVEAGVEQRWAQKIAEYSQFVDDYTASASYIFDEVPNFALCLTTKTVLGYRFYPVTTGFSGLMDMARLTLKEKQKEILVPFHFIPTRRLSEIPEGANRREYCTYPADITGTSLIKNLIVDAKTKYMEERTTKNRMRLSMLLHTFADTYAHQNFSGFHGWENFCYLTELKNTYTGKIFRDDMTPEKYYSLYAVGHTEVGHAPDFTYASFEMDCAKNENQKKKDKFTGHYERNNTNVFLDAANQIFKILYQIQHNNSDPTEKEWNRLKGKLIRGFRIKTTDTDTMGKEWNRICPNIIYAYDVKALWQNLFVPREKGTEDAGKMVEGEEITEEEGAIPCVYKTADDNFFYYNVLAKEIRDAVIL